ncbi:hypothetical protein HDE_11201 [Halotydeus destructor]|nr:hypothetical protein HDE_11201 [Halotydeus destructor]
MASSSMESNKNIERSLNELAEPIITRVFHFVPFWRLMQMKNIDSRFNHLVQKHFKIETVFDFRTPCGHGGHISGVSTDWLSSKLFQVKVETEYQQYLTDQLQVSHPQLFLEHQNDVLNDVELETIPDFLIDVEDASQDQLRKSVRSFYKLLDTRTKESSTGSYVSIGHQRKVSVDMRTLHCLYRFLSSVTDRARYEKDFSAVRTLTIRSSLNDPVLLTVVKDTVTYFSGLKYLVLELDSCRAIFNQLRKLKDIASSSSFQLALDIGDHDLFSYGILEDTSAALQQFAPQIRSWKLPMNIAKADVKPFEYMKRLTMDTCDTKAILKVGPLLKTVEHLTLFDIAGPQLKHLSDMIEQNGRQLKYINLTIDMNYNDSEEDRLNMKRFYEAIGNGCPALEKLHLQFPDGTYVDCDSLKSLLVKIGPSLTSLQIDDYIPNDGIVAIITERCKNLKYLNLALEVQNENDIHKVRDQLKQLHDMKMLKLVWG